MVFMSETCLYVRNFYIGWIDQGVRVSDVSMMNEFKYLNVFTLIISGKRMF